MSFVELGNAFEPRDYVVDLVHRVKTAMERGVGAAERFPTRASGGNFKRLQSWRARLASAYQHDSLRPIRVDQASGKLQPLLQ